MKRTLLVALATIVVPLFSSEPSAFGAGNLNNPNPYGLTLSEEVILQNKNNLHKVVIKSNNQANEVDSIRDRIDGLQAILEGLAVKSQENKMSMQVLNQKSSEALESSNEYEKRLTEISQKNSQNIEEIKMAMSEISRLVDTINSSYVTKSEFNNLVTDINKFKDLLAKEFKHSPAAKKNKSEFEGMKNSDIETKAKAYYDKKYYTKAIEHYTYLIEKNYKPATSNYMIGEMKYYRKNYADAIAYFKKSASLHSTASYMPTLMIHTALSMDKTGDKTNAKTFYEAIIAKYPNSKHANDAEKYLTSMK